MSDQKSESEQKAEDGKELTFVVTTNPYERQSAAHKKRVRSVAALKSWPERRKKTFERHSQSHPNLGGFVLDKSEAVAGSSKTTPSTRKRSTPSSAYLGEPADEEPLFEKCTRATDPSCRCLHCQTERRYRRSHGQEPAALQIVSQGPPRGRKRTADGEVKTRAYSEGTAFITPPSSPNSPSPLAIVNNAGRAEPFSCYPVEYLPWFDRILHHSQSEHDILSCRTLTSGSANNLRPERLAGSQDHEHRRHELGVVHDATRPVRACTVLRPTAICVRRSNSTQSAESQCVSLASVSSCQRNQRRPLKPRTGYLRRSHSGCWSYRPS